MKPGPRLLISICLLLLSLHAEAAEAVIEWFPKAPESTYAYTSYMLASSRATGDNPHQIDCTIAMLYEPTPLYGWYKQQRTLCKNHAEDMRRFQVNENTRNSITFPDKLVGSMHANGQQNSVFTSNSLRVRNAVSTDFEGNGALSGVGSSFGDVYFRVPGPVGVYMRFKGTMDWSPGVLGNRGRLQITGMPNSGADLSVNIGSGSISNQTVPPAQLWDESPYKKRDDLRYLKPGVYKISWGIENSVTSLDGRVSLEFEVDFQPPCGGTKDSDGDGMPDEWENIGIPVSSGRCVPRELVFPPAPLPKPDKKEIYVELDQMTRFELTSSSALRDVTAAFSDVRPEKGPKPEIKLHILPDEKIAAVHCIDLRDGEKTYEVPDCVENIMDGLALARQHFGTRAQRDRLTWPDNLTRDDITEARRKVFHHALAVDIVIADGDKAKGFPYTAPDGQQLGAYSPDFFVAVGRLREKNDLAGDKRAKEFPPVPDRRNRDCPPTRAQMDRYMATTFMHELGHTLGLEHGGCATRGSADPDCVDGKPNYLSIMSYGYGGVASTSGLACKAGMVTAEIDYSREALDTLDECNLREAAGIGAGRKTLENRWVVFTNIAVDTDDKRVETIQFARARGAIDWNLNGDATETIKGINIHNFDEPGCPGFLNSVPGLKYPESAVLKGYNDWAAVEAFISCRLYFPGSTCLKGKR